MHVRVIILINYIKIPNYVTKLKAAFYFLYAYNIIMFVANACNVIVSLPKHNL